MLITEITHQSQGVPVDARRTHEIRPTDKHARVRANREELAPVAFALNVRRTPGVCSALVREQQDEAAVVDTDRLKAVERVVDGKNTVGEGRFDRGTVFGGYAGFLIEEEGRLSRLTLARVENDVVGRVNA